MTPPSISSLRAELSGLDPRDEQYASQFIQLLLDAAQALRASDIHLQPGATGLEIRWRMDGVLQELGTFPAGEVSDLLTRLKVLAELLTYRTEVPQEGRIRDRRAEVEMRVSTYPTLHGERAVVRLFADDSRYQFLEDLGYSDDITATLRAALEETSGALIVSGPAGSGKTTALYAALREIVRRSGGQRSLVSLEDPIEVAVDGVAQSQVNEAAGFGLAAGLRSLLRQDPEVLMVGEIRDPATAAAAFQASLTGHLVLTSFHAGSAGAAISRLSDMGIEDYLLRSGVLAIISQRLVRRLCRCAVPAGEDERLGLPVAEAHREHGCAECNQTGFRGRMVLAELLQPERNELGRAVLQRADAGRLQELAVSNGMIPLSQRALTAVEQGHTSPSEIRRVLGFS